MSIVLMIAMLGQVPEGPIDASQLSRLLGALRSDVEDVSLVFEGFWAGCKEGTPIEKVVPDRGMIYQGHYALRLTTPEHFYAALLDNYVEHRDDTPPHDQRETYGILQGRMISFIGLPDEGEKHVSEMVGGPGSIRINSPENILYWWYFSTFSDLGSRNYEYLGWEEVDGHRCLKFQVDLVPEAKVQTQYHPVLRFWIDLTRGGHPLRMESLQHKDSHDLNYRVVDIKLAQLPLPNGKLLWFPVAGRVETFLSSAGVTRSPVGVETYGVVNGTVRFNQHLSDDVFRLKAKLDGPETDRMAKQRSRYELPPPRNDLVGIKERLDRKLIRANQQTKQLDASAPVGEGWWWLPQAGLMAIGILILSGAAAWKWGQR